MHADVSVRAGHAADHHQPRRVRVAHTGGPQQPYHHTARRDHSASGENYFSLGYETSDE